MTITSADILDVTTSVTKKWTKQRKAEERGRRSRTSRSYVYSDRVKFKDVMDAILPAAYDHASGGGEYTVPKRQIYYASREAFKEATGREIGAGYLCQTLLVQYMNSHPETVSWKVTADPRGALTVPNGHHKVRVPCGTLAIEGHLRSAGKAINPLDLKIGVPIEWPSLKHGQRYQAVIYIEKEGFEPMLEEAQIAQRFDVAILSCKGQSVVAARRFVDEVCRDDGGVPLFVVHDFDKAGFEISQRLTTVSDWAELNDRVAYRFRNKINAIDIGLRLEDVERYKLGHETVDFHGGFSRDSIATAKEREFLRSGRRVELNAFMAPQFIEWLESKLTAHGLGKRLIPDDAVLADAYRRARLNARIKTAIGNVIDEAAKEARTVLVPKTLRRQLQKAMKQKGKAWDVALYDLVKEQK